MVESRIESIIESIIESMMGEEGVVGGVRGLRFRGGFFDSESGRR